MKLLLALWVLLAAGILAEQWSSTQSCTLAGIQRIQRSTPLLIYDGQILKLQSLLNLERCLSGTLLDVHGRPLATTTPTSSAFTPSTGHASMPILLDGEPVGQLLVVPSYPWQRSVSLLGLLTLALVGGYIARAQKKVSPF